MAIHSYVCLLCVVNILSSFPPLHLCPCPPLYLECNSASTLPCQTSAYLSLRLGSIPMFSPKSSLTSLAQIKLSSVGSCNLLFRILGSTVNPILSAHFDHFTCMALISTINPKFLRAEFRVSSSSAGLSTEIGHNRPSTHNC